MNNTAWALHLRYGAIGLLLGYCLSRIGFSNFDEVHRMFLFVEWRLFLCFALAVALSFAGFTLLQAHRRIPGKPLHPGTVPGSILFGTGWAVTGACPGVALVQLGEGQLAALFTILGILVGVWIYKHLQAQLFDWDSGSCGE